MVPLHVGLLASSLDADTDIDNSRLWRSVPSISAWQNNWHLYLPVRLVLDLNSRGHDLFIRSLLALGGECLSNNHEKVSQAGEEGQC